MDYLVEILKIVEGALSTDRRKVVSYTELLAKNLEAKGESQAANKLYRALNNTKKKQLTPTHVNSSNRVPVDKESRLSLGKEEYLHPSDAQMFLEKYAEKQVEDFLSCVRSADRLIANGVDISASLLLYGSPGCGKTQLAKYIAAQLELPLITAQLDSMISSFLGSTAKNLRYLFDHAASRPCVLFLDEFDALAKLRDDQYELGELKRVVVSLLQNIDSLDNQTILIAATNHEHLLDPAIWRRFTFKIQMDKPSFEVRKRIIHHFVEGYMDERKSEALALATENLSGDEIRIICQNSKRRSILNKKELIDIEEALRQILETNHIFKKYNDISSQIVAARNINQKVFTYQHLAKIFECSVGHISNILKSERGENAGRNQTTN